MTYREVVREALAFRTPPYVPWSFGFTREAHEKLKAHYSTNDIEPIMQNHMIWVGNAIGGSVNLGGSRIRDIFGVEWDQSVDGDIGNVSNRVLPEPTIKDLKMPDPLAPRCFADIPAKLETRGDRFRLFPIGFSLYERAWTLRGMENLLVDFVESPEFVHDLLDVLTDYNIAQIKQALTYDIDAVHFGDDWGQQVGLQMGYPLWRTFIYPRLERMYSAVRSAGKLVSIHCCGDVDELFDDLVGIGLNCFNPFQPEVMDVWQLLPKYRGRLAFHGGLSTQRTLPYGTPDDVRNETKRLLELGRSGGYILAPAHAVEGDVPLENMLAFIETVQAQPGFRQNP